ncbi:Prokaryotic membrane lipoprotein lipid attachment site [Carpediemonas membranifera]|uniref:Prokaryotic membrane lipoprotein lipid attachment site n=1 Tax=Carpediemonas membranifera TaxID=201153 RepID=A0A8J6B8L9_9EUKA|nr:Prokaryotic membrane lipoprotein lipid attachment site [Carpediemonas membranifera]|eukprot:KAG9395444.1 Prokaryotic membrane lipoprotein lipid attachment site [Carpediemonas membranifera]
MKLTIIAAILVSAACLSIQQLESQEHINRHGNVVGNSDVIFVHVNPVSAHVANGLFVFESDGTNWSHKQTVLEDAFTSLHLAGFGGGRLLISGIMDGVENNYGVAVYDVKGSQLSPIQKFTLTPNDERSIIAASSQDTNHVIGLSMSQEGQYTVRTWKLAGSEYTDDTSMVIGTNLRLELVDVLSVVDDKMFATAMNNYSDRAITVFNYITDSSRWELSQRIPVPNDYGMGTGGFGILPFHAKRVMRQGEEVTELVVFERAGSGQLGVTAKVQIKMPETRGTVICTGMSSRVVDSSTIEVVSSFSEYGSARNTYVNRVTVKKLAAGWAIANTESVKQAGAYYGYNYLWVLNDGAVLASYSNNEIFIRAN